MRSWWRDSNLEIILKVGNWELVEHSEGYIEGQRLGDIDNDSKQEELSQNHRILWRNVSFWWKTKQNKRKQTNKNPHQAL